MKQTGLLNGEKYVSINLSEPQSCVSTRKGLSLRLVPYLLYWKKGIVHSESPVCPKILAVPDDSPSAPDEDRLLIHSDYLLPLIAVKC